MKKNLIPTGSIITVLFLCVIVIFLVANNHSTKKIKVSPAPTLISKSVSPKLTPDSLGAKSTPSIKQEAIIYFSKNITDDCSQVEGVKRSISSGSDIDIAEAVVEELLKGPSDNEVKEGYSSMFNIKTADSLINIKIDKGTVYINLKDIRNIIPIASASCGSQSFFSQMRATLKQNIGLDKIIFAIEGNPQPFYEWMQIGCSKENNFCDKKPFDATD